MTVKEQIDSFHRFAMQQVEDGQADWSLDALYDQWRMENPSPAETEENIAAIQAAIDDMNRGDRGRAANEVIAEVRSKYNLSETQ